MLYKEQTEQTSVEKLLSYQKHGYLFHGSSNRDLTKLSPKAAKDTDPSNKYNNDTAVFASKQTEAPVLFGCINNATENHRLNGNWSIGSNKRDNTVIISAKIPKSWQNFLKGSIGYVYVLPNTSFKQEEPHSWQIKSYEEVTPIDVVEVTFEDFEKLGGIIDWVEE